jgi:anti-anti-sigma regulatory factor
MRLTSISGHDVFAKTSTFRFPNNATVDDLDELRKRVATSLTAGATFIILDFEPAGYVSPNALGKTIGIHRDVVGHGGELILCGMDRQARATMTKAKLDHMVEHVTDYAAAWAMVRERIRASRTSTSTTSTTSEK